ncbi:MAG: DUF2231 domain-containing protein [Actinomycetota bacterium]|nr:DUF2231 domain-containing protein [Actinomycetota bacterium]
MRLLVAALRGFRGHPAHPALTDVTVGAWTVNAVAAVCGLLGFLDVRMVDVAYISGVITLASILLTIPTGAVDYVRIERGSSMRRTATLHWVVQIWATSILLVATGLLGSNDGVRDPVLAEVLSVAGWLVMVFGSWVGGAMVTVHGMRVLNEPNMPTAEAISPKFPPD